MSKYEINIANDFSTEPFGRYLEDGDSNGTKFRDEFLLKALQSNDLVKINFDGAEGYGSSFLDEAFGGLVRVHGFTPAELKSKLELVSNEDPSLVDEVWSYIDGK